MRSWLIGIFLWGCAVTPMFGSGAFDRIENYLVYYGWWNDERVREAQAYDLVILHPGKKGDNISKALVGRLQRGRDGILKTKDDVMVIAYVSIGEDENMERGARRVNTSGYKGPVHRDAKGKLSFSNNGFRNWYVDQKAIRLDEKGNKIWGEDGLPVYEKGRDRLPDENGKWHSYYVNVADIDWQRRVKNRVKLVLETYGCDGVFLDTVDTASPWGAYGWMQKDMVDLIFKIRSWYPKTSLIMNRGLFLFEKYGENLNRYVDGVMFESYVSEWDWYRSLGTRHRWFSSNRHILFQQLAPLNRKKDGIFIFFLNYVDRKQLDAPFYFMALEEDSRELRCVHAISTPDLQRIVKPFALPKRRLQVGDELEVREKNKKFLLDLSAWKLGRKKIRFMLSAKFQGKPHPQRPFILLSPEAWDVDTQSLVLPELPGGEHELRLSVFGEKGELLKRGWATHAVNAFELGRVEFIDIAVADRSLRLSWNAVPDADSYEVNWGSGASQLNRKVKTSEPKLNLNALLNGMTCFFRVRAVSGKGTGAISELYFATPTDCTPPKRPILIQAKSRGKRIEVSWKKSLSPDVAGYYLYLDPAELTRGIPIKLPANVSLWKGELKHSGEYRCRISAHDGHNNESLLSDSQILVIP